jgi:flagellar biosynthesis/type III secretory pathway protein FliH
MDPLVFENGAEAGASTPGWRDVIRTVRMLGEDQYRALLEAGEIAADTKRQRESAAKALADAENAAREIRGKALEDGQAEGFRTGYEEGLRKGREEGRTALDAVSGRWLAIGDLFEARLKALIQEQETLLVNYAAFLAERFLRERLQDPAAMSRHLQSMIEEDLGKRCLAITVHPQSLEAVRRAVAEIPAIAGARIETDRKLETGDMLLGYERQVVDGRVGTMLGAAASVFLGQVLKAR